ncbi:MAG: Fe-S cluster assembly protein SufD [Granulosicoccaceae bacterium]|jgi:Fe-S cluster assembly protein SufD
MITADQQHNWLQQLTTRSDNDLPENAPVWLREARDTARQAMVELPVPHRKQEAWRYTSIDALLKHAFRPAEEQPLDEQALDISDCLIPALDAYRLVFVNGHCVPQLSTIRDLPAGVTLGSLRAVLSVDPEMLSAWFGQTAAHTEHVFTALNTALLNDGMFLHVESGVDLDRPIEVIYLSEVDAQPLLQQPRNLVVLDEGASATLVERFMARPAAAPPVYFHNNLTEIAVGKGASLAHYRVQDESRSAYHLSSLYLSQQADSHYRGTTFSFGGAWARTDYTTTFKQEGAECVLNGLYTVGDQQLTDFHLDVRHSVPGCASREQFKGVLYGKGRAVFDGRILVDKQAQHSDAHLTNDNLMLTRKAEVDTKPQLEIYADDVKCSHGTTVGQLDPQQVFYLRSRGLDEAAARKMLCLGFAGEIVDHIEVQALRDEVAAKLNDTLDNAAAAKG